MNKIVTTARDMKCHRCSVVGFHNMDDDISVVINLDSIELRFTDGGLVACFTTVVHNALYMSIVPVFYINALQPKNKYPRTFEDSRKTIIIDRLFTEMTMPYVDEKYNSNHRIIVFFTDSVTHFNKYIFGIHWIDILKSCGYDILVKK